MKILISANSMFNVLNFRLALIRALIGAGHDVSVLAPFDVDHAALVELGCDVFPIEMDNKGTSPVKDVRLVMRFVRAFRQLRPDLVLSYTIKNNVYGALAARRTGTAFLPTVTGLGTAFLSSTILRRIACILYAHSFKHLTHVVFQNTDDRDTFLRYGLVTRRQSHLIRGSGVDTKRFEPVPLPPDDLPRHFLMIARMLRDKGVVEFIEAARICKLADPHLQFSLLGPADVQNRTAIGLDQLRAWETEGSVRYLGERMDVRDDIAAAHCIVLPSYREGMSRVLLEAASMGRPLVTTDVPGCRDIVEEGVNGFLCKPTDAGDLARKLQTLANLPRTALVRMGQAGHNRVMHAFSDEIVIAAYLGLIAECSPQR